MPLLRPLRPWLIGALLAFISSASSLASAPATLSSSLSLQVCFHLKTSAWTTCPEFSYLTPPPTGFSSNVTFSVTLTFLRLPACSQVQYLQFSSLFPHTIYLFFIFIVFLHQNVNTKQTGIFGFFFFREIPRQTPSRC